MSKTESHIISGWRITLLVFVMIVSSVGYLFISLWGGWDSVKEGVSRIGIDGFILALSFSLINYFVRFNRWNYFLLKMGQKVPFWSNFRVYIAGFSLTATPGKSGEAIRGVFLHDFDVPYRNSFAAFLGERISDVCAIVLLALMGLWKYHNADYVVMGMTAFIIFILFAIQKDSWLKKIENFANNRLPGKVSHSLEFLIETVLSLRVCFSTKALTVGTILGVIAWAAEAVAFYIVLTLLGVDIPLQSAVSIYAVSLLIGAITFLPGGLGGVEVSMIHFLMLAGASPADAATATILIRVATLWFSVFLGLLAIPRKQIVIRNLPED